MNITIGANIKKYRLNKGITQEQLSEALGITCAAVSKWERCETYPDITLLFPIAHYFGVSIDELMGYEKDRIEQEIEDILSEYQALYRSDKEKSRDFITQAYRKYPNDYRIMSNYMWNIGGDYADNDPNVLLENKEVFISICDRLLDGCTDEKLRLDAWNMKAKILHAEGRVDEALTIYNTKFTNWYFTSGQKTEQLFAKDTPEFLYYCKKNMYELASFAADKISKSIFFDKSVPRDEGVQMIEAIGDALSEVCEKTDNAVFALMAHKIFGRLSNDIKYRCDGSSEDVKRLDEKKKAAHTTLELFMKHDRALAEISEHLLK